MIEAYDDDEPEFYVRYNKANPVENKDEYWEQYDAFSKCWIRLCKECTERVRKSSEALCVHHYNRQSKTERKSQSRSKIVKKEPKRLQKKDMRKNKIKKMSTDTPVDTKIEEVHNGEFEELNESSGIVISLSSALNKKQISQVKEFIVKFHNRSQTIEFTCDSQPDYIDDTTTHIITHDSGSFTTLITKQIIQACARHIFVGSINWIISSIDQSCVLDYFPYEILRDKNSPKESRGIKQCRFDQLPVFPSSYVISVECHNGVKEMKMNREELIEIVELSGATLLNDYLQYSTLVILCNSKKEMINRKKQNDDNLLMRNEKTIYYCKPELLFDSIVRHEVQAVERYTW